MELKRVLEAVLFDELVDGHGPRCEVSLPQRDGTEQSRVRQLANRLVAKRTPAYHDRFQVLGSAGGEDRGISTCC